MTYTFVPVLEGRHRGTTMVTVVQDGTPTAPAGRFLALVFGGLAARTVEGALRRDLEAATRQPGEQLLEDARG